jgi:CheY-like chemotaxis protein
MKGSELEVSQPRQLAEVLCVEDHPACLKVVQEALREFAEVRGAGSIQRALDELEHCTPTLLLLDLDLPDGDGLQVLDHMRQDPRLQGVPVLVISAAVGEAGFAEARRRGAQACLAKPIDLAQVRRESLRLLAQGV